MSDASSSRGTILVVDDEQDTAYLLAEILRRRGFEVTVAGSAHACLELLTQHTVDVVVTDVMMPGISGLELCEALRARFPDILSIVVTGRSDARAAISAIRAGAHDYLAKPVSIGTLEGSIMRALERRALRRT